MEETTKRILLMVMVMIPIRDQLGGTITEFTILLVVCHEDDVIITKMSCSIPLRLFITRKTTQLPNRPKRWKRPQQPNRKANQLPTRHCNAHQHQNRTGDYLKITACSAQ